MIERTSTIRNEFRQKKQNDKIYEVELEFRSPKKLPWNGHLLFGHITTSSPKFTKFASLHVDWKTFAMPLWEYSGGEGRLRQSNSCKLRKRHHEDAKIEVSSGASRPRRSTPGLSRKRQHETAHKRIKSKLLSNGLRGRLLDG